MGVSKTVSSRSWSRSASVSTVKSEGCWPPKTVSKKTDNLISGLAELQTHLTEARMAREGEANLADVLKMMVEMTRDKQERDRRYAEREEQRVASEEKRLREYREERQEREDRLKEEKEERRKEDLRREERRDRREQEIRNEAELREAKLLMALKDAQPAVPQTIHLDNTKLPTMSKGEDVELFIELFETALTVGGVPEDKWTAKLQAALDTETKLSVKETITNTDSTYEDIKGAGT